MEMGAIPLSTNPILGDFVRSPYPGYDIAHPERLRLEALVHMVAFLRDGDHAFDRCPRSFS